MSELEIERLQAYQQKDAEQIGRLMTFLSEKFSGEPINEDLLTAIIDSPDHDQLVARLDGRIVGAATMSIVIGAGAGRHGYLEDFVTDPLVRGKGVGTRVWNEIVAWCKERELDLNFTSRPTRAEAHKFYHSHGAIIRDTTVFKLPVQDN